MPADDDPSVADAEATTLASVMAGDPDAALARWAASGAMALTGSASGPPLASPATIALAMDHWAGRLATSTAEVGQRVEIDGPGLLGERAAIAELHRRGRTSAGGHTRMLAAADGWLALSLARVDDLELLPAWLGLDDLGLDDLDLAPASVDADGNGIWPVLDALVRDRSTGELLANASLLGLPCGGLGEQTASVVPLVDAPHSIARSGSAAPGRSIIGARVVDLSSLWAGPLCAHLLGLAGARIAKVESTRRPDGARAGPSAFYDLLHAGHESVALDLGTDVGRGHLRRLVASADVVIEASRPRALAALGCSFADAVADGFDGVWMSITAFGREGDRGMRVGFGDDAAIAGGLVAWDDEQPVFVADAIADPATGLLAAVAVADAFATGRRGLLSVSLAGTAAHLAAGVVVNAPVAGEPPAPVAAPRARSPLGRARPLGADTDAVLRTW